jgi:hypothetical protein
MVTRDAPPPAPLSFLLTAHTHVIDKGFDTLADTTAHDLHDLAEHARLVREEEAA